MNRQSLPLKGMQVVDLGKTTPNAICSLMLADFGAEVVQVIWDDTPYQERVQFASQNRGKSLFRLHADSETEYGRMRRLLASCDAVILDDPAVVSDNNFGYEAVRAKNSKVVYTVISGFGIGGPYGARSVNDEAIQAESGVMSITGEEGGKPLLCGGRIADHLSAYMGCIGTLMAVLDAMRTGNGRLVDVSSMDTLMFGLENQFSVYLKNGIVPEPIGNNYRLSAPVGVFPCKDGEMVISVATDSQWRAFSETLGHLEWICDPAYQTVQKRIANYKKVNSMVEEVFAGYTSEELMQKLQNRHCIYGRINTFLDVVSHPQVRYRQLFTDAVFSDGECYQVVHTPIRLNQDERKETCRVAWPED